MNRRTLLMGVGSTLGSGLVLGSSAFSSTSVDRTASVAVVEDYRAYLALDEVGSGGRSTIDGGELKFAIPGTTEESDADGVGTNSVYRFSSDADGDAGDGLFTIQNQGTDPINVYSTQSVTSGVPSITIFEVDSGDLLTEDEPYGPLGTGNEISCGLHIDTEGVDIQDEPYDVTIRIHGEVPD